MIALRDAVHALQSAQSIVVFTGAGVSAESGIATFRDSGGFWQRFPPERFASWNGLRRTAIHTPGELIEFLIALLEPVAMAQPNAAHRAIADLQEFRSTTVITQNIDELHQEAGSTSVCEIHGTLFDLIDSRGRFVGRIGRRDLLKIVNRLMRCRSGPFKLPRLLAAIQPLAGLRLWHSETRGAYRPRIVMFGDALAEPDWTRACGAAANCDAMLVVGTSGLVWPAATLPIDARQRGAVIISVDPEASGESINLRGNAGEILPRIIQGIANT